MSKPEPELLLASLGTGVMYRRWQKGDILIDDGEAMIVADVEDDGTPTGTPIWSDKKPSKAEVERRRELRRKGLGGR